MPSDPSGSTGGAATHSGPRTWSPGASPRNGPTSISTEWAEEDTYFSRSSRNWRRWQSRGLRGQNRLEGRSDRRSGGAKDVEKWLHGVGRARMAEVVRSALMRYCLATMTKSTHPSPDRRPRADPHAESLRRGRDSWRAAGTAVTGLAAEGVLAQAPGAGARCMKRPGPPAAPVYRRRHLDEEAWRQAPWTESFVDIRGEDWAGAVVDHPRQDHMGRLLPVRGGGTRRTAPLGDAHGAGRDHLPRPRLRGLPRPRWRRAGVLRAGDQRARHRVRPLPGQALQPRGPGAHRVGHGGAAHGRAARTAR